MKKKTIIFLLLFSLFIFSSCSKINVWIQEWEVFKTEKTILNKWNITLNNSYIWTIEPLKQTIISAETQWKITNIYVKENQKIKKWNLIATIDTDETNVALNSANKTLQSLKMIYNNTESFFDSQIKSTEKKINQAKIMMNSSNIDNWTAWENLKNIQLQIETYKTQLDKTEQVLNQNELQIYSNSKNAITQSMILLKNVWVFLDELLWISKEKKIYDDAYSIYLWAKNTSLKNQLKTNRYWLNKRFKDINNEFENIWWFDNVLSTWYKEKMYNVLLDMETFLNDVRNILKISYNVVDSSVSSSQLPQTSINKYKNIITNFQKNIEWSLLSVQWDFILWVKWSRQTIDNFNKEKDAKISMLKKQIELATQQLKSSYSSVKDKENIYKQQYQEALLWLEWLKKQKQLKLSEISLKIEQTKSKLNEASVYKNNAFVSAPFDWIILNKLVEKWQFVWPWTPIAKLWTNSSYKVIVSIPDYEINKYKIWDKVAIFLSNNIDKVLWKINNIFPMADMMTQKVSVEITFDTKKNIVLWSTAKVIIPEKKISWYKISSNFIYHEFWEYYSFLLSWWKLKKTYLSNVICNDDAECIIKWNWIKTWTILVKYNY